MLKGSPFFDRESPLEFGVRNEVGLLVELGIDWFSLLFLEYCINNKYNIHYSSSNLGRFAIQQSVAFEEDFVDTVVVWDKIRWKSSICSIFPGLLVLFHTIV